MANLFKLPAFDGDHVRCVVETPRGSPAKFKYDPELKVFTLSRPLLKGLTYPYDWGFIPSTLAPDGDPTDAMILYDTPSFAGLVIPCRIVGMLEVEDLEDGERTRNDRVFLVPEDAPRESSLKSVLDLPDRMRKELESFFVSAALCEKKELSIIGWVGPNDARREIEAGMRRFEKKEKG